MSDDRLFYFTTAGRYIVCIQIAKDKHKMSMEFDEMNIEGKERWIALLGEKYASQGMKGMEHLELWNACYKMNEEFNAFNDNSVELEIDDEDGFFDKHVYTP